MSKHRRGMLVVVGALWAAAACSDGSSGGSAPPSTEAFCARWVSAGQEARELQADSSGDGGGEALGGRLQAFMELSLRTMTDLADLAPPELRPDVVVLRDYYQAELDSGLRAETPSEVDTAETELESWVTANC